jgi:hypothetical protein
MTDLSRSERWSEEHATAREAAVAGDPVAREALSLMGRQEKQCHGGGDSEKVKLYPFTFLGVLIAMYQCNRMVRVAVRGLFLGLFLGALFIFTAINGAVGVIIAMVVGALYGLVSAL